MSLVLSEAKGKTIAVLLENGWGNVIIELMTAHWLTQRLTTGAEPVQVLGLVSLLFLRGYTLLYLERHKAEGLPEPHNIAAILPHMSFDQVGFDGSRILLGPERKVDVIYAFHDPEPNMAIFEAHNKIFLRADWIGHDINLIIPELLKGAPWLEQFRPAPVIQNYINKYYLGPLPLESLGAIGGLHIRVQQPNGDDTGPGSRKQPTTGWFREALKRLGPLRHLFVIVAAATMCPECTGYVDTILTSIREGFPELTIQVVSEELYYVDFFLLASLPKLVISSSTLPWLAAVLGSNWGATSRVIVPPQFVSEFGPSVAQFPGFEILSDSGDTPFVLGKELQQRYGIPQLRI